MPVLRLYSKFCYASCRKNYCERVRDDYGYLPRAVHQCQDIALQSLIAKTCDGVSVAEGFACY
jgi:hypothetical protein